MFKTLSVLTVAGLSVSQAALADTKVTTANSCFALDGSYIQDNEGLGRIMSDYVPEVLRCPILRDDPNARFTAVYVGGKNNSQLATGNLVRCRLQFVNPTATLLVSGGLISVAPSTAGFKLSLPVPTGTYAGYNAFVNCYLPGQVSRGPLSWIGSFTTVEANGDN